MRRSKTYRLIVLVGPDKAKSVISEVSSWVDIPKGYLLVKIDILTLFVHRCNINFKQVCDNINSCHIWQGYCSSRRGLGSMAPARNSDQCWPQFFSGARNKFNHEKAVADWRITIGFWTGFPIGFWVRIRFLIGFPSEFIPIPESLWKFRRRQRARF